MKKTFVILAVAALVAFAAPAFAANPFMDVPMNHWAYDAVSQLASHGVISGYPDGSYKGAQPATRYEMASIVARALAKVDLDKASKQDVEMLKKLVVEFKDELDALGVKVDKIDARVAVLEKDMGGWSLSGQFRMDAKFGNENPSFYGNGQSDSGYTLGGKNEFDLNRYRIFLKKRINETTTFTARLGTGANDNGNSKPWGQNRGDQVMEWERYYITTKLPYDITLTVGRQNVDWEDEAGLYVDDDAWIGDFTYNGFIFQKSWGMVDATVLATRNEDNYLLNVGARDMYRYGARFNFNINEQFRVALSGLWDNYDNLDDMNSHTIYGDFEFKFNPSIALKGAYYTQNNDINVAERAASGEDSPTAWKVIVDAKQDLLKFTSLWLEYGKIGEGFRMYQNSPYDSYGAAALNNRNLDQDTTIIFVRADQKWNDKWSTFVRYFTADFDTTGIDDTKFYTFGVGYQLNPAVGFELSYDKIDYGDNNPAGMNSGDDNVVRLRTVVNF
ncbi:S-layer domain protein [Aminomonas paucivorans DSM 12260]|uniref:S-layer domain protein n=1 Tax=Aminomonas paucivorans DSM 12260 TaxID=584708 RepID=E3CW90_9BACT|nr:S-layer homology domain-containing protein [Aminomonas paucivorans]EFQ23342.1 S-layer domain protein [Aminomonas paucivorans DSM 12260]